MNYFHSKVDIHLLLIEVYVMESKRTQFGMRQNKKQIASLLVMLFQEMVIFLCYYTALMSVSVMYGLIYTEADHFAVTSDFI